MACGSWQSDDQLFLRFEKSLVSRLIGWSIPTDRAELLPIFLFEKRKNFFGGEFLVKPKRGLALLAPCNGVLNVL